MQVSPIGFALDNLEAVLAEAKRSAEVTHNHPEGIKGAQAIASAIFLARTNANKAELADFVTDNFGYCLDNVLEVIRPNYQFDVTGPGTVPAALLCFLESVDFEDALRNAVSLGGDSDTLACITGAVAQAYYSVIPSRIEQGCLRRLVTRLREVAPEFIATFIDRNL